MADGNFPSVQAYLRNWSQILIDELRKSAVLQMKLNKADAKYPSAGDPQASQLVVGMHTRMDVLGTKVEAQILMPKEWYWLEHGRSPGKMPPEEPIVKWLVHRGFKVDISSRRKKQLKRLGNRVVKKGLKQLSMDKKLKQLAYLIRRRIGAYGTRETKFVSNVINEKLITDLRQTIKEKYKKDIIIGFVNDIQ